MSLWTDLRDTAESAAVVAGNYVLPGSSLITSKLVSDGSKEQLNSDLGILAQLGSGGAGAMEGNLANYQTAANSILGSVSPGTTVESISQATGLTGAQLAKLGITAASLLAGGKAISNIGGAGNTGGLGLPTQDRSGFSAGSANYAPEYYQAIQAKYNQYMPQGKGADITTDLKNWYETKYTPNVSMTGIPTATTTGTGYTTADTLANLKNTAQAAAPLYTSLSSTSTPTSIANAYGQFAQAAGGDNLQTENQAIAYLRKLGIPDNQIMAGYKQYVASLNPTAALPKGTAPNGGLTSEATPEQIAKAYAGYASANGGDTQANKEAAVKYLRSVGVSDATIQAAYPLYLASVSPQTGSTGLLTGSTQQPTTAASTATTTTPQPLYTQLSSSSSPSDIAAAYSQFVNAAGGDTLTNQKEAAAYLTNLGIPSDTIMQGYGLFKGA